MIQFSEKLSRRDFIYVSAGVGLTATLSATSCNANEKPDRVPVTPGADIPLPAPALDGALSVEAAIMGRRSERNFRSTPLDMKQLSQLLWAAQGITDPHPNPARRFRRAAPSAGAQYPLDVYVVAGLVEGLEAGVYHHRPREHTVRLHKTEDLRRQLAEACLGQMFMVPAPVSIVITAEYGRITGRYGERGIRYTHMEVGHVGQNLHLQAEALGLGTVVIGAFRDREVAMLLSLPQEHEPLYVMPIGYI
jgi:SagB-type dehydrogenase family enzyme